MYRFLAVQALRAAFINPLLVAVFATWASPRHIYKYCTIFLVRILGTRRDA
jgi:hypothetical protein